MERQCIIKLTLLPWYHSTTKSVFLSVKNNFRSRFGTPPPHRSLLHNRFFGRGTLYIGCRWAITTIACKNRSPKDGSKTTCENKHSFTSRPVKRPACHHPPTGRPTPSTLENLPTSPLSPYPLPSSPLLPSPPSFSPLLFNHFSNNLGLGSSRSGRRCEGAAGGEGLVGDGSGNGGLGGGRPSTRDLDGYGSSVGTSSPDEVTKGEGDGLVL